MIFFYLSHQIENLVERWDYFEHESPTDYAIMKKGGTILNMKVPLIIQI